MHTLKIVLITLAIVAPLAGLATSYAEDRLQYNLWDWLKDRFNSIRGRVVYDKQITVKFASADIHKVEAAVAYLPKRLQKAVKVRV